jgi:predicted nuclease of predicted toxin-antitoxin system
MKLLVDMNLSPRWVSLLNGAGIEAVHWSTVGATNAPDREIMAYALAHDFVVLTHDLDFSAILAVTQGEKPSVVQLSSRRCEPRCDRSASAHRAAPNGNGTARRRLDQH